MTIHEVERIRRKTFDNPDKEIQEQIRIMDAALFRQRKYKAYVKQAEVWREVEEGAEKIQQRIIAPGSGQP